MIDPYKILGVPQSATDDEVRTAYRELARQYHPDNHQGSPAEDMAEEKMIELNNAYDRIMDMRRSGGQNGEPYANTASSSEFSEVRRQLQYGNITAADELLEKSSQRNAEWSFLKGTVCYKRGWLSDAYSHYKKAVDLEPNNPEYLAAFNNMNNSRQGNMNGSSTPYGTPVNASACPTCNLCSGLICADCCCECCGGDLIPCC